MPTPEQTDLWSRARAIPCPHCKAEAGQPCKYTMFLETAENVMPRVQHMARYKAANEVAKEGQP